MFYENSVKSRRVLYTPSPFAKSALLYLQECGTLTALKHHKDSRSKLSSYLMFIVLEGSGRLTYSGAEYSLSAGDCVFIDCEIPYSHFTADQFWKLQWVHFNGTSMNDIYQKYFERGGQPVFRPEKPERITTILDEVYCCASSEDYIRDMRINEQLAALMTQVMEMSRQSKKKRISKQQYSLQDIKAYLDENWTKKLC